MSIEVTLSSKETITIKLSNRDYEVLLMMLGYANGSTSKNDAPIPDSWKSLTDWILIQGHENNYTYWNDKNRLRKKRNCALERRNEIHAGRFL